MWKVLGVAAILGCGGTGSGGPGGGANPEDLIKACVVIHGCLGVEPDACVRTYGATMSATQVDCVLATGGADCLAVRTCLGTTVVQDPACVPGCADDHTSVRCSEGLRVEYDCGTYIEDVGPNCVTGATRSDCGGTTCTVDGEHTCAGAVSSTCDSGITEVVDCAQFGLECTPTSRRCFGARTGTCAPGTATSCDGLEIVECIDGEERRTDCGRRVTGMTCVVETRGPGCAFGAECVAGTPTCEGTHLVACVAGRQVMQDCTALGFATCGGFGGPRCQ